MDLSHPAVSQFIISGGHEELRDAVSHLVVVTPMNRAQAEAHLRTLHIAFGSRRLSIEELRPKREPLDELIHQLAKTLGVYRVLDFLAKRLPSWMR